MNAGGVMTWWVEVPAGVVILALIVWAAIAGQVIGWCVLRARASSRRRANCTRPQRDSGTWQVYR